jgi:hypothetical protein
MYKKQVKIKNKKYNYYYHNFKVKGKVKNICLGRDKKNAIKKLEGLIDKDIKGHLNLKELQKLNFHNSSRIFFIVLIFLIGVGILYALNLNITGLTISNNNLVNFSDLISKFKLKELFGLIISLELMTFGYFLYRDYKVKVI